MRDTDVRQERRHPRPRCWLVLALAVSVGLFVRPGRVTAEWCQIPDNGTGKVDLPPECPSGYGFPAGGIKITEDLPLGTSLRVALTLGVFEDAVRTPGGALGGERVEFDAATLANIRGTGMLEGFSEIFAVPTHVVMEFGVQAPADEPNVEARIVSLETIPPIFNTYFSDFRVKAGEAFGLPSPGWVKLLVDEPGVCVGGVYDGQSCASDADCPDGEFDGTCVGGPNDGLPCLGPVQCPLGSCFNPGACDCGGPCEPQFHASSSFDLNYELTFEGRLGFDLEGLEGVVTGILPFQAGSIPTMYMQPVGGTGNELAVRPGERVTIEIYVRDLSPDRLTSYQATLPRIVASSGVGELSYYGRLPEIDVDRSEYVFNGLDSLTSTVAVSDPTSLVFLLDARFVEVTSPRYLGTFFYEASPDAFGDFEVGFVDPGTVRNSRTVLGSPDNEPIAFQPVGAVIQVASPSCETGCNDAYFCNGVEVCVDGACVSGESPCAGGALPICDEDSDACVACLPPISFELLPDVPTGDAPASAVLGDLDGDGFLDLVWANHGDNTVAMMDGRGDGTFESPPRVYPTGRDPRGVALADLDGDGLLDLVSANETSSSIQVRFNGGGGEFGQPTTYWGFVGARFVTTEDLDLDGDVDLVVANLHRPSISVVPNNGEGTLAERLDYAAGDQPRMVDIADFDDDGWPDLVVVDWDASALGIYLGEGDLTFSPLSSVDVGPYISWVDSGDLNGDGAVDLAVAHYPTGDDLTTISVLFNDGSGSFGTAVPYASGYPANTAQLLDADGDDDLDLAYTAFNQHAVVVMLNDGSGSFSEPFAFETRALPRSIDSGDLDGDGLLDLVVATLRTDHVTVLRNEAKLCIIDGACYPPGAGNAENACEYCDPEADRYAWTLEAGCLTVTCQTAAPVEIGTYIGVSDLLEADDDEAGCHPDSNSDAWFAYPAECTATHVLSTAGSQFSPVNDTVLSVYDDCGGVEIACDDDSGSGLLSEVTFEAVRGETYFIRVAGGHNSNGEIVLEIDTISRCIRTEKPSPMSPATGQSRSRE